MTAVRELSGTTSRGEVAFSTRALLEMLPSFIDGCEYRNELEDVVLLQELAAGRLTRADFHAGSGLGVLRAILLEKASYPGHCDAELQCCVSYARGRVLDFGGGAGDVSAALACAGVDVSYVEINDACRAFARYLFERLGHELQEGARATYDTVLALNVLDHLDDPLDALLAIHDQLNDGGVLVASFTFDRSSNPVHVGGAETILSVEDCLKTHFEEIDWPGKLDEHRVFRKRRPVADAPRNRDGSLAVPPATGPLDADTEIALADEIEITRAGSAWRIRPGATAAVRT